MGQKIQLNWSLNIPLGIELTMVYRMSVSSGNLNSDDQKVIEAYSLIEEKITWHYVYQMLDIMKKFLLAIEKDLT